MLGFEDQSVGGYDQGNRLDIFGCDIISPIEISLGACRVGQIDALAGRDAGLRTASQTEQYGKLSRFDR